MELRPLVVRRPVAFAEAVYSGTCTVEGVTARRIQTASEVDAVLASGMIPVLVDAAGDSAGSMDVRVLVDARMLKTDPGPQSGKLLCGSRAGCV